MSDILVPFDDVGLPFLEMIKDWFWESYGIKIENNEAVSFVIATHSHMADGMLPYLLTKRFERQNRVKLPEHISRQWQLIKRYYRNKKIEDENLLTALVMLRASLLPDVQHGVRSVRRNYLTEPAETPVPE